MKLLLTGATGFAGGEVLRQALADPRVDAVVVLTRRPLPQQHAKLRQLVLSDFLDYRQVAPALLQVDACIWCLGVSQTAVNEADYIRITHDFTLAAAQALRQHAPQARFCFLSGSRADPDERARILYGRIKGRTERALGGVLADTHHFRPALIRPTRPEHTVPTVARVFGALLRPVDWFTDSFSVGCDGLARCLLDVAINGASERVFDNARIRHWQPRR